MFSLLLSSCGAAECVQENNNNMLQSFLFSEFFFLLFDLFLQKKTHGTVNGVERR